VKTRDQQKNKENTAAHELTSTRYGRSPRVLVKLDKTKTVLKLLQNIKTASLGILKGYWLTGSHFRNQKPVLKLATSFQFVATCLSVLCSISSSNVTCRGQM